MAKEKRRAAIEARLLEAARQMLAVTCCQKCKDECHGYLVGLSDALAMLDGRPPTGVFATDRKGGGEAMRDVAESAAPKAGR